MINENLSQYRDVKKEIDHIEEELKRLEMRMLSPRASILSDVPKGPISNSDQMADNLIKLEELRDKYKSLLEELCERQLKVEEAIAELEPLERDLIRYRYVDGLMWRDVSEKIGYAQRQTHRIHDKILEKLENFEET